jgi:chemosensory pili system protein ChpA (sensor histidine kinase/response regulator)
MSAKRPLEQPLVLLVEDDPDLRDALVELLEAEGFAVVTAADGIDAFEQLRGGLLPSVIVTDLNMPRMDGWQLRNELLADPALGDIPTVVMSGTARIGDASVSQLGAIEFVPKPIHVDTLLVILQRLSRRGRAPLVAARR